MTFNSPNCAGIIGTGLIVGYPVPSNDKELKQFLGLSNYYKKVIKNYALIAEPLHKTQRKSFRNDGYQIAFQTLKQKLLHH